MACALENPKDTRIVFTTSRIIEYESYFPWVSNRSLFMNFEIDASIEGSSQAMKHKIYRVMRFLNEIAVTDACDQVRKT